MRISRFTQVNSVILLALLLVACSTVPITGRTRLSFIPDSQLRQTSTQQYQEFLAAHKVSQNQQQTAMVKEVGRRIRDAVIEWHKQEGRYDKIADYQWEINLIEDDQVNAWAMPGGKIVVYTGLLPVAQDASGLAVVMGHEVAHVIAGHGGERMSQALTVQMGGLALNQAMAEQPEQTKKLAMGAFGAGTSVGVLLPYSRLHESEADKLGLIFMAMAGYDPQVAVDFWKRMSAKKGGAGPPEILSTHPADDTRIRDLQEFMPQALGYYRSQK